MTPNRIPPRPAACSAAGRPAIAAAVLGLATAVAALVAVAAERPATASERIRIVLLPIVVHSAESPEYVRGGLADMLASRLERIPDFEVMRVEDPSKATTNLAKALKVARGENARYVVFGSFTRFGTGASLDIQCAATDQYQTDDPQRDIFIHSGTLGDVIPDLDDLVGKVARFAVEGYVEAKGGTAAATAGLPSTREIGELKARVASLEKMLRELTARLETARVLPPEAAKAAPAPAAAGAASASARVAAD